MHALVSAPTEVFSLAPPAPQHESRVQKEAQAKLTAKAGGAAAGPAAGAAAGGKKQPAALLYDLVFNKQSEFCTKVWVVGGVGGL